ncbi:hypothetical protein KO527_05420 [Pseudoalteromonas sp. C2R02]|uniref:hypothetical protein n=1 Tax=Pseudoalteromonas sp. C2R02 TaxID=2841565 RepID=UPI001C07FEA2|nr:hypothetical protein [Pseudoalteromonas sp. C2R02]MBU2968788.1 hypothetical protein [Pseudoalteromonas sp. C2R02]
MADSTGKPSFLKKAMLKNRSIGQTLKGYEFKLTIAEFPDLSAHFRTSQWPATKREIVDDNGFMGVSMPSYGALDNSPEITITAVENIEGKVMEMLRDVIVNGKEVTITMEAMPESADGIPPSALIREMEYCLLTSDAIDASTEDTTTTVKPSITVRCGWLNEDDVKA